MGLGLHWRRARRSLVGLWRWASKSWHRATEHRFERLVSSHDAAIALQVLLADANLKFGPRLARVDDEMGGYTGATDLVRRSIKIEKFCLWELERYCEALAGENAWLQVGKTVAERYVTEFLPPLQLAEKAAQTRVAEIVAYETAHRSQDVTSKQLWIAATSALASAAAAIASVVAIYAAK